MPLGLYAHRDYIQRKGNPTCLEDLRQHDLIGPDRNLLEREMIRMLLPELKMNNSRYAPIAILLSFQQ